MLLDEGSQIHNAEIMNAIVATPKFKLELKATVEDIFVEHYDPPEEKKGMIKAKIEEQLIHLISKSLTIPVEKPDTDIEGWEGEFNRTVDILLGELKRHDQGFFK